MHMKRFWSERPKTHEEWKHLGKYVGVILILVIPVAVCEIERTFSKPRKKRPAP